MIKTTRVNKNVVRRRKVKPIKKEGKNLGKQLRRLKRKWEGR